MTTPIPAIITLTLHVPGGLPVARSNRTAIQQATSFALLQWIQQTIETRDSLIVNRSDERVGEVSLTATYSDAAPRKNYGVMSPDECPWIHVEPPVVSPTQDR